MRENNVYISKVCMFLDTFFGRMENIPFTKRSLKNLSGLVNKELANDYIKTHLMFSMRYVLKILIFFYRDQVELQSRIETLHWTNGRSRYKYKYFGDVITFDTTY